MKYSLKFLPQIIFLISISLGGFSGQLFNAAFADEEEIPVSDNPLTATAKFYPFNVGAGGTSELQIEMKLVEHYHAYADRFKLRFDLPEGMKADTPKITPLAKFNDLSSGKTMMGLEGSGTLKAVVEVPQNLPLGPYTADVVLTYQACTKQHCLFPKTLHLKVPFEVNNKVQKTGSQETLPVGHAATTFPPDQGSHVAGGLAKSNDFQKALGNGLFSALLFIFAVGFLTSLTPCIYPMIPITLAILGAKSKGQTRTRGFLLSLVYVLGIAFTYSSLGVIAASTGSLFGSALSNVYVVSALALLFVAMGLSMYGLFEIQAPAFIRDRVGNTKVETGFTGSFVTGLMAGVVASPCIGPVLVSVLTYIAQTQNKFLGFLFLFTFAMGMGILFIVLGTFSHLFNRVPKAGPWMEFVKFVFGTTMIGMALYYIAPLYPAWLFRGLVALALILIASAYGAFEPNERLSGLGRIRKGAMLSFFVLGLVFAVLGVLDRMDLAVPGAVANSKNGNEAVATLNWQPYTAEALASAKKAGKPVIIDFSAEWCAACHELDKYTFSQPEVRVQSSEFVLLHVDATEESPSLTELKNQFKIMGLPTILFFTSQGQLREDLTLTGFEDAQAFLTRMQSTLAQTSKADRAIGSVNGSAGDKKK